MLQGKTVFFLGKLTASNRAESSRLVREHGGRVVRDLSAAVNIVVVGEGDVLSRNWNHWNDQLDAATKEAFESGSLEIVSEAFFWDKYGDSQKTDSADSPKSLFTPSMLSEIINLPVSTIRQLERRQIIIPTRNIHRLNYYDIETVLTLRIIRNILDAGVPLPRAISMLQRLKRVSAYSNFSKIADVRFNGKELFFVTKNGIINQHGQLLFNFITDSDQQNTNTISQIETTSDQTAEIEVLPMASLDVIFGSHEVNRHGEPSRVDIEQLYDAAWQAELDGDLVKEIECYRTIMFLSGSTPQLNFQIAELLYRCGELAAARERYFVALEQDEEFVEARANLGCVLAELGEDLLAVEAFRGALRYHPEYAEAHFHLGMLLARNGLSGEAKEHLQLFIDLMPDSSWATKAEQTIANISNVQSTQFEKE
jgi:tetratricopeptide (TPR) repeat protein